SVRMRESTKMPFLFEERCSCTSTLMAIATFDWRKPIRNEFWLKAKRVRIVGRLNKAMSPLWRAMKRIWRRQWSLSNCHTIILPPTDNHEKTDTIPFNYLRIRADHGQHL